MKLVHPDFEYQLRMDCQKGCQWVIEPPELLTKYVWELIRQSEGREGNFVLSEEGKEKNIAKSLEIIVNPFEINVNDKRILSRLYAELVVEAMNDNMYLATREIQGKLQNYFANLEQSTDYILTVDEEIDLVSIFKAIGVRMECDAEDFMGNIILYIRLLARLLRKEVVVFVNLSCYFTVEQLKELVKSASYSEISILLIESRQWGCSNFLNRYIIDRDYCEIF